MQQSFPDGVYPVMLTPFDENNAIDYSSLEKLINWYLERGVAGLFSNCQSSEMFFLSLDERVALAKFIIHCVGGRVPVIVSGHISDSLEDQAIELNAMADAGSDAVILLTNRLAKQDESEEVWFSNLQKLMKMLPSGLPLGFYECPYPYKRLISNENLKWCADSGRFYFIKDTCCNIELIKSRLDIISGSQLKLFNANTSTLLDSLQYGASGFSGVMANFHPELYAWLTSSFSKEPEIARKVADFLTVASFIEMQVYPVNSKYFQKCIGNFESIYTRVKSADLLDIRHKSEVEQLGRVTEEIKALYGIGNKYK